jgi:hypothetical protein
MGRQKQQKQQAGNGLQLFLAHRGGKGAVDPIHFLLTYACFIPGLNQ